MIKNTEIELKLLVGKAGLKKLLTLDCVAPYIRQGSMKQRQLVSSYYDTKELALKQRGIAYRVRDKGDGTFEATVKTSAGAAAGLSRRLELNLPLSTAKPVLDGFAELGLDVELSQLAPEGVQKLFTVKVERTVYILDLPQAVVELAVDKGRISAGRRADKIDEIELELLDGDVGALLQLAEQIAEQVPLFLEKRSKFVRGLALFGVAVDEQDTKKKMGGGWLQDELPALVQQQADALLMLQNSWRTDGVDTEGLKEARRLLTGLRSCIALQTQLTGGEYSGLARLEQLLEAVERARGMELLLQQWSKLAAAGQDVLGRAALPKKLTALLDEKLIAIQDLAEQGKFTALVYSVLSWLEQLSINEAERVQTDSVVRRCLKEWSGMLASPDNGMLWADNSYALARSVQGKYFTKFANELKKERRQLRKEALLDLWLALLKEAGLNSGSKLLHRDIGVVLGYLLAQRL